MADVAFGIAGVGPTIHRIGADSDFDASVDLTMTVTGSGKPARCVSAAAIRIRETEVARHVTPARRLTDCHAGRTGRAQATAAVSAARAEHAVDLGAVRGTGRRRCASADAVPARDRAGCGTTIRVTRARVTGLNTERRAESAGLICAARTRTTIAVVRATVACRAAAVVQRRADLVAAAASATAAGVVGAAFTVGHALHVRAFARDAAERTTVRARSAVSTRVCTGRDRRNTTCLGIAGTGAAFAARLARDADRVARRTGARRARARPTRLCAAAARSPRRARASGAGRISVRTAPAAAANPEEAREDGDEGDGLDDAHANPP